MDVYLCFMCQIQAVIILDFGEEYYSKVRYVEL